MTFAIALGVLAGALVVGLVLLALERDRDRATVVTTSTINAHVRDNLAEFGIELEPTLVRVHPVDEKADTIEGILVSVSGGHYRLRRARQLVSADLSVSLDGETWIPADRVLYVQRL